MASATLLAIIALGVTGFAMVRSFTDPPYQTTTYEVPDAPRLTADEGETLLRIDPSASTATYEVDEHIVGQDAGTATGTTQGIAGDVAVNLSEMGNSRVGTIVINVEQFHSDNSLRDARIRGDYLESHRYPIARFVTRSVTGLDGPVEEDQSYEVELSGDLTVKDITNPVTWSGTVRYSDGSLHADVRTTVKLSDFDAGPISIVGLVSTSDDVELSLELVAHDPAEVTIPKVIPDPTAPDDATDVAAGAPSFAQTIRPILEDNCVSCHEEGAIGSDTFLLDDAGDASQVAAGLSTVTANGYMPPWPPSTNGVPLQDMRALDQDEIDAVIAWAESGGHLDVDPATQLSATPQEEPDLPRADVVMQVAETYLPDPDAVNDFRCFILDPAFTTPTYVTGSTFTPGNREIVHHALIHRTGVDLLPDMLEKDGSDGRPGWSCTGEGAPSPDGAAAAESGRALIGSWLPGNRPQQSGENQGYLFQPGDQIVVQVHYHQHGGHDGSAEPEGDRSALSIETQAPTPAMHNLVTSTVAGPVELPCPAPATGPLCDRAAMMADQIAKYGPATELVPSTLIFVCGAESVTSDPVTGNGTSECDWPVTTTGEIVEIMGHMHYRGSSIRLTLNPGTSSETVLLDIPRWNFGWQLSYQPVDPVQVVAGDRIGIECSWDRSLAFDPEPRYISFNEGTEDEMCFSTYTVNPSEPTGGGD